MNQVQLAGDTQIEHYWTRHTRYLWRQCGTRHRTHVQGDFSREVVSMSSQYNSKRLRKMLTTFCKAVSAANAVDVFQEFHQSSSSRNSFGRMRFGRGGVAHPKMRGRNDRNAFRGDPLGNEERRRSMMDALGDGLEPGLGHEVSKPAR